METSEDTRWLRHACELAERGRGHVEPNPVVGAVVVRDGGLVGEGWHQRFGGPHAEVNALADAGEKAAGATLYVTLEPCSHQGKTPPCTEAIIGAGIHRVVAAMVDPFPAVAGKGFERLKGAGVMVDQYSVEEVDFQSRPYLTLTTLGRPYVHAKWAMSLDGKIATRTGHSQWISNAESRQRAHALRGRMDAIMVGSGTVRRDNPLLTARPPGPRIATRIVLSTTGTLPENCRLLATLGQAPILVATLEGRGGDLRRLGCEVLELPPCGGRPAVDDLLKELGRRRMTNVLVEGGESVLGSFADAGLIDEIHTYIAPLVIGGITAVAPVGGLGIDRVFQGRRLLSQTVERIGDDVFIRSIIKSVADDSAD